MSKRVSHLWLWCSLGLLLVGLGYLFLIGGWRAMVIKTPSMGQTAPVGSLVLVKADSSYDKQEIISFRQHERIYTHRIVDTEGGKIITKGDMNGTIDPWRITNSDIIGQAHYIIPHAGWLMQALPWLLLGWLLVYLLSCWPKLTHGWRWPIRIMGFAVVIALISVWLHPWLNFGLISYIPSSKEGVDMHIVNTGIFPLKAEGTRLVAGQDATVNVPYTDETGRFILVPQPSLGHWGVLWVMLFCVWPMVVAILVRTPSSEDDKEDDELENSIDRYPWLIVSLVVILVIIILWIQISTMAAFTAAITNNNQRDVRTYFTCRSTTSNTANPRPWLAYAIGTSLRQEVDISGNNRTGSYTGLLSSNIPSLSDSVGCRRDTPAKSANFSQHCLVARNNTQDNPNNFSIEVWFKTNLRGQYNGKIAGFGSNISNSEPWNDRHIYLDKDGRVVFGVYPNSIRVIASPAGRAYDDNQWHHVVATLSSTAGMALYVDGERVAQNTTVKSAQVYIGYWRFGCGRISRWRNGDQTPLSGKSYFTGNLQYGAIYDSVLTPQQVREHYLAGAD